VTSKSGRLEPRDDIKKRIEEATKFVALDQLCLSPQCGFASTEEGNVLAEEEQWAKLRMIVELSNEGGGKGGLVSRAQRGTKSCAADPGPRLSKRGPGPAAHHSLRSCCAASGTSTTDAIKLSSPGRRQRVRARRGPMTASAPRPGDLA